MDETQYRRRVEAAFKRIGAAFDDVDPDVAEYEYAQGAVSVTFSDRSKLILSQQPAVRQIWIAAASRGRAFHLSFDASDGQWKDDKGEGVELYAFVRELTREKAAVELTL